MQKNTYIQGEESRSFFSERSISDPVEFKPNLAPCYMKIKTSETYIIFTCTRTRITQTDARPRHSRRKGRKGKVVPRRTPQGNCKITNMAGE